MVGEWLVGQWIVRVRKYLVCKTSYSGGKVGYQDFTKRNVKFAHFYLAQMFTLQNFAPCIILNVA